MPIAGKGFGVIGDGDGGIVNITTNDFIDLVQNSQLNPWTIYNITDVNGIESVFIQAITTSTYIPETTVEMYLPNYTVSGAYKGQYHSALGAVADGEIYTWGEWNWENESGGPLTPDLPDANTFDTLARFTKLTKSTANSYTLSVLSAGIAISAGAIVLKSTSKTDVNAQMDNSFFNLQGLGYAAIAQFNQPTLYPTLNENQGVGTLNNRIEYTAGGDNSGIFYNESGQLTDVGITNCYITGTTLGTTGVVFNDLFGNGNVRNVVGNVRVQNNSIIGGTSAVYNITCVNGYTDVLHCHIHDNSHIFDITHSGSGKLYFWDCELHENVNINGWTVSIGAGETVYFKDSYLNADVDLVDFTYTDSAILNFLDGQNFKISNATDITFDAVKFVFSLEEPQVLWDFTGFATDIKNETIESGKGWFNITHDFTASPLTAGSSVLYNFIPPGAYVTNMTIIPDTLAGGAGAELAVGMSVDDATYGLASTAVGSIVNTVVNTVSNQSTGNRSLEIAAAVNNATSGTLTVKVEFVMG